MARRNQTAKDAHGMLAAQPFRMAAAPRPSSDHRHRKFAQVGDYAGRAVFRPHHRRDLKAGLFHAIGKIVELDFAGRAGPDEQFSGQNLYQERSGNLLQSSWVPEEDLEFID
jgi:hypothetical protein